MLTDLERIAPCLPGAQLQEVEDDEHRGRVKVKVGPIVAHYKGTARFVELDRDAGRAVLSATGRDTKGQGNATATITADLVADGAGTAVRLTTELKLSGKVAQFGRSALGDVSERLIDEFVANLEQQVLAELERTVEALEADVERSDLAPRSAVRTIDSAEPEAIDLLSTAGGSAARRVLPIVAAVGAIVLVVLVRRRRRTSAPRSADLDRIAHAHAAG